MSSSSSKKKTILFHPLNSPGHINSLLGLADRLRDTHGYRVVFLILGPMIGKSILEHKHELIQLDEEGVYEDYPIEDGEDLMEPVDEEAKKRKGIAKVKFEGALKWPQIIMRYRKILRMEPVEAFINSIEVFDKFMVSSIIENHAKVEDSLKRINPDMVVVDSYFIPPCIVNLKHIPWIRLHSANPYFVIDSKLPNGLKPPPMSGAKLLTKAARQEMREQEPARWEAMLNDWKSTLQKVMEALSSMGETSLQKFMQEHNCPPLAPGKQAHDSPHLNLYLFPREFDYDQDDDIFCYPPRWFGCDSLIRKSLTLTSTEQAALWEEKLVEGMKGKKEMIYFSLGSIASGDVQLMKYYIGILRKDKERLYVISKGVNGDQFELDPDNMIGGNFIPQTFFLDRASLAIIHGGNNSITECAYYGIPQVVLPLFGDQIDNAQRVEDLGYGRRLNAFDCTETQLRQTIEEVLSNTEMIEKCREMGKAMRSRDEVHKVSLLVKKLVEEGHLEQDFIEECRHKQVDQIKF